MDDDELWAPAPTRTAAPSTVDLGLPGYTDLREVARGGDSVVYRARQAALHRDVAIKVLLETDPATVARFARELELTVRLGRQHPHIVTVLDTGTTAQGHPCLVMDFHDLGSLHDRLRAHGPLPAAEVVAAGTDVADALAFAHDQGVLHRDVKPQNVLLLPTSYVLTDFGIARMADAGHTASLERFSYRHASPQVLDGLEPTATDDVWSLGSTLHTLLDGRAPFASPDPADDTALGYLRRVRTGARRPLDRDDVPDGLRTIIDRCLAPAREDRYPSADEVHAALVALPTETRSWTPQPATPVVTAPRPTPPVPVLLPALELPPVQPEDDHRLAPSALSLLAPPPVATDDDEATGLHPEAFGAPRPEPEGAGGRRPWVRVVGFVGGAILIGSALGGGATLWASSRTPPTTATLPSAQPTAAGVPTREAPTPAATDPQPDLAVSSDPAIAPTDVVAVDQGTSLDVSWSDPTGGAVQFVLVDPYATPEPRALAQVDPGITQHTVEGVDPQAAALCVLVLAIAVDDVDHRGVSEEACVQR
ncbi:serine/threonine-protein kinase [Cellulomonas sp. Leaf334]|uniref:serine/threonine-protein kinase n=1 Tax=Cellulomonas sp. Leaf334 TaxID=1736339 RepID=UPI000700757C|nr:serine/threonine-protein kinase [Cellulomonas sp. Leaf334]KQR12022.1 hypothetical protein ASF78_12625 [Cellulomonas sp. Leaf334]